LKTTWHAYAQHNQSTKEGITMARALLATSMSTAVVAAITLAASTAVYLAGQATGVYELVTSLVPNV